MATPKYGFGATVSGESFDAVVERVTEALAGQGFGVLASIDIGATLKKKLDVDFRPYVILGACNPELAVQALGEEPHMGLLLPCNVVVQATEDEGRYEVSFIDPSTMLDMVESPGEAVTRVAQQAETGLRAAAAELAG